MSMLSRISKLASGPQGRRLANEAKRIARDPDTRRKIEEARRRFARKRDRPT